MALKPRNHICLRQFIPSGAKLKRAISQTTYQHQIKITLLTKYPNGKSSITQSNSNINTNQKPTHNQKRLFICTPYSNHHQPAISAEIRDAKINQTHELTLGAIWKEIIAPAPSNTPASPITDMINRQRKCGFKNVDKLTLDAGNNQKLKKEKKQNKALNKYQAKFHSINNRKESDPKVITTSDNKCFQRLISAG